jgi:hypothetical protein
MTKSPAPAQEEVTLIGDKPLQLLDYDGCMLMEYSVRFLCGRHSLVFIPEAREIVSDGEGRTRERVGQMHGRFVNSSLEPFVICAGGQALDFSEGDVCELMM